MSADFAEGDAASSDVEAVPDAADAPDIESGTRTSTSEAADPWPELTEFERAQRAAAERRERMPRWIRFLTFSLAGLIGFRIALLVQQITIWALMQLFDCPQSVWDLKLLGGRSEGLASCSDGQVVFAVFVGIGIDVLLAGGLFFLFGSKYRPRNRFVGLTLYMAAIGAISEVLSVMIVFAAFDQFEAGDVRDTGVSLWILLAIGFGVFVVFVLPLKRSVPYFASEVLGWPEHQLKHFEHALWIKLTAGVVLISLFKIFV